MNNSVTFKIVVAFVIVVSPVTSESRGGITDKKVTQPPPKIWCKKQIEVPIKIIAHVANEGDKTVKEDEWVGVGNSNAIQAFTIDFDFSRDKISKKMWSMIPKIKLKYMCHLSGSGDKFIKKGGVLCGKAEQLEGFQIGLTGSDAKYFEVDYGCHLSNSGNTGPDESGYCGTKGQGRAMEKMWVSIKSKGECVP